NVPVDHHVGLGTASREFAARLGAADGVAEVEVRGTTPTASAACGSVLVTASASGPLVGWKIRFRIVGVRLVRCPQRERERLAYGGRLGIRDSCGWTAHAGAALREAQDRRRIASRGILEEIDPVRRVQPE